MTSASHRPQSMDEIIAAVRAAPQVMPVGGGTKTGVHRAAPPAAVRLDMTGYAGIIEYEPGEYTFTARAGTTVAAMRDTLAIHGQYLPFDPPLAAAGSTLGGVAASGLSGSARQRYGGVRDFLIGVRLVDGTGRDVRGGGKVVKNAAGFDLPKLMVGSLGQLGVLTELSFKVFPEPAAYATLRVPFPDLAAAHAAMAKLTAMPLDLEALDIFVHQGAELRVRLGGLPTTLPARMDRVRAAVGDGDLLDGDAERAFWADVNAFAWADAATLVKIPLSPTLLDRVETQLARRGAPRLYSAGAAVAWCALDGDVTALHAWLADEGLAGLVVRADDATSVGPGPLLGAYPGRALFARVKRTLDPQGRFPDFIDAPVAVA